jgi:hypothetical protein
MNKYEKALEMSDEKFFRMLGFSKKTIVTMVEILW